MVPSYDLFRRLSRQEGLKKYDPVPDSSQWVHSISSRRCESFYPNFIVVSANLEVPIGDGWQMHVVLDPLSEAGPGSSPTSAHFSRTNLEIIWIDEVYQASSLLITANRSPSP
jgi:hypothetical protein